MKVLLAAVNAKYIHSNPAVYCLKRYAGKRYEENIEIVEYTINQSLEEILGDLYRKSPNVLALSCYIWNWECISRLLPEIKKVLPDTKVWLGGPQVSYRAKEILSAFPSVKGIMRGEGEETFLELVQLYMDEGKDLSKIAGISFSQNGEIKENPDRALLPFEKMPFPYEDLAPFENRILYYESQRGCPYHCRYCLSSIDKSIRKKDIDLVKKELQFFFDRKVKQVKFVDRTFNCDHTHAMEVWKYIHENDNGVTNFHFEIAADILNEEEISLLNRMRPGLVQLEIGVQSTHDETLRAIDRHVSSEHIAEIVASLRRGNNVHIHLDLIAGLPYEDYQTFQKSFNDVYAMQPEQLQLGFLKVLSGTPMEEDSEKYGITYLDRPPFEVLSTKWISYGELRKLKRVEEMVELYYNSNQYTHTLPALVSRFDSPFSFFYALAEFYEENGYVTQTPQRQYRYEILLSFARKYDPEREEFYKEALTFDVYLRENAKTRPSFARDMAPFRKETNVFLRENAGKHLDVFSFPVWMEGEKAKEKLEKEAYIAFCYDKRNPLNKDAMVEEISFSDEEEKR